MLLKILNHQILTNYKIILRSRKRIAIFYLRKRVTQHTESQFLIWRLILTDHLA